MRRRTRGGEPPLTCEYQEYLPSRDEGLHFAVHVRLFGIASTGASSRGKLDDAGADHLRAEFERVTCQHSVVRWRVVRQLLAARLSELVPFSLPGAELREATVVVHVASEHLDAGLQIEHARHELELDELAHRQVRARMRFLREECLRDPASAELFTLLPPSPRLADSSPAGDPDRLVNLVRNWQPTRGWVRAAEVLIEFGNKLTSEQLLMLGTVGRQVMESFSEAERGQQFAEALKSEAGRMNGAGGEPLPQT